MISKKLGKDLRKFDFSQSFAKQHVYNEDKELLTN